MVSSPAPPWKELFSLSFVKISFPSFPLIMLFAPDATVILSLRFPPLITLLSPLISRVCVLLSAPLIVNFEPLKAITPVFVLNVYLRVLAPELLFLIV